MILKSEECGPSAAEPRNQCAVDSAPRKSTSRSPSEARLLRQSVLEPGRESCKSIANDAILVLDEASPSAGNGYANVSRFGVRADVHCSVSCVCCTTPCLEKSCFIEFNGVLRPVSMRSGVDLRTPCYLVSRSCDGLKSRGLGHLISSSVPLGPVGAVGLHGRSVSVCFLCLVRFGSATDAEFAFASLAVLPVLVIAWIGGKRNGLFAASLQLRCGPSAILPPGGSSARCGFPGQTP